MQRFIVPEAVENQHLVLLTGFGGLFINIIGCLMFSDRDENDLNTKAAFFHILCDLAGSIIVIASTGISMILPQENIIIPRIDPIASMLMAILLGSVTYFTVVSKSGKELLKILEDFNNNNCR
uniref:Cation efflux protein transmembrane domain-containing protein n=1 Tax=Acrobeloides nanus TaxID=290746 RepID=A0A914D046_9BILA